MTTAAILLAHGSRSSAAGAAFAELSARVRDRLPGLRVEPAYLQMQSPLPPISDIRSGKHDSAELTTGTSFSSLPEAAARLADEGATRILVLPYFLHAGRHVAEDVPAAVRDAEQRAGCPVTLLTSLENAPLLEDLVVDRLTEATADPESLPETGDAIESLSHEIIDRRLDRMQLQPFAHAVVRRIVHSTADFSFIESLRLSAGAAAAGVAALRAGALVVCDCTMTRVGITRTAGEVVSAIHEPAAAERAKALGTTRAAAAMDLLRERLPGSIIAIGNAPTALWRILELAREGVRPALVVGLPVGFVGARESKHALAASDLPYITNLSPRGGSPAAAAAVNALALLAKEPA